MVATVLLGLSARKVSRLQEDSARLRAVLADIAELQETVRALSRPRLVADRDY